MSDGSFPQTFAASVPPSGVNQNVPIDLSGTYGALFVGLAIALILWGMQTLQSVWYYLNYPKDPRMLKIWIAAICLLSTLDVGFSFAGVWEGTISSSGAVPQTFSNPSLFYRIVVYGVVGFLSQLFFLYRIIKFADILLIKYGIPLLLLPLIVYQMIANIVYAALWLRVSANPGPDIAAANIRIFESTQKWVVSSYAVACATDIVIAFVMGGLLLTRRSGIARTDRLLVRITITSINTGSWTAVNALLTVILTLKTPQTDYIFAVPSLTASTLYANSVLCNLNVRQFFRASDAASTTNNNWGSSVHKWKTSMGWRVDPSTARSRNSTRGTEQNIELPTISLDTTQNSEDILHTQSKASTGSTMGLESKA